MDPNKPIPGSLGAELEALNKELEALKAAFEAELEQRFGKPVAAMAMWLAAVVGSAAGALERARSACLRVVRFVRWW